MCLHPHAGEELCLILSAEGYSWDLEEVWSDVSEVLTDLQYSDIQDGRRSNWPKRKHSANSKQDYRNQPHVSSQALIEPELQLSNQLDQIKQDISDILKVQREQNEHILAQKYHSQNY